jgi:cytochrome c biogenesis factor
VVAVAAAGSALWSARRRASRSAEAEQVLDLASMAPLRRIDLLLRVQGYALGSTILVVLVGTLADPVARAIGSERRATGGTYYAQLLLPVALVVVVLALTASFALLAAARRAGGRSPQLGAHAAHAGVLVVALGVVGSTASVTASGLLDVGETLTVGDHRVTLVDSVVEPHGRAGSDGTSIRATVAVQGPGLDGVELQPRLDAYPERGIVLAETSLHSTPARDVQVAIRNATPDGRLVVEAAVRPMVTLVWWGSLAIAMGAVVSFVRARAQRDPSASVSAGSSTLPAVEPPAPEP